MVNDERLHQLAYDPMMCNIPPEVYECLRELVELRRLNVRYAGEGPHVRILQSGLKFFCGGPGRCEWCDQAKDGK